MSRRNLSHEDRILWSKVARTATPLPGKMQPAVPEEPLQSASAAGLPADQSAPKPPRPQTGEAAHGRLRALDAPTHQKLVKGRLPIEARVDLHGLNQVEAHSLLLSFLHRAFAEGIRHVLVITGKGSSVGSDGILRRAVPIWLGTTPFRPLVSAYDNAGRAHGGGGALYVRLRRRTGSNS